MQSSWNKNSKLHQSGKVSDIYFASGRRNGDIQMADHKICAHQKPLLDFGQSSGRPMSFN